MHYTCIQSDTDVTWADINVLKSTKHPKHYLIKKTDSLLNNTNQLKTFQTHKNIPNNEEQFIWPQIPSIALFKF